MAKNEKKVEELKKVEPKSTELEEPKKETSEVAEPDVKDEAKAEIETESDSKAETKTDSKTETKTDSKTELESDSKTETGAKAETKPDDPPTPPPKPPRPLSPFSASHLTLSEAFPTVEPNIVRAVLIASSGLVDPAFNGLLSLSDPDYKLDERLIQQQRQDVFRALSRPPPKQKPVGVLRKSRQGPLPPLPQDQHELHEKSARRTQDTAAAIRSDLIQVEEDEKLARMLAAEYDAETRRDRRVRYADTGRGTTYADPRDGARGRRYENDAFGNFADDNHGPDARYGYDYEYDDMDKERSFFDDDLPQIQANLQKGFNETKEKVNSWVENLKKRMDGDDKMPSVFSSFFGDGTNNPSSSNQYRPVPKKAGFDRDPDEVDFESIKMQDDTAEAPRLPRRPTGAGIVSSTGHEHNIKPSKWEPLQATSPEPVAAAAAAAAATATVVEKKEEEGKKKEAEEDDPFFIGDSEEEEDEEVGKKTKP